MTPPPRGVAVVVSVCDQGRSDRFYREILGAVREPGEPGTCPWYRLGALRLSLLPNAERPTPARFPAHAMFSLWIEVADLAEIHRRCVEASVSVLHPPDGYTMWIADPDGLAIEIVQQAP